MQQLQPILDFFWTNGVWTWFALAVLMLILETVIPGVHFMWFGVAAVAVGAALLIYPFPLAIQLVAFAIVSLIAILWARRMGRPEFIPTDLPDLNVRGQQYVGRVVTIEEPIVGGRGKVRVGDTLWVAEGPDLGAGTLAKVTGVNGTVLVVAAA